MKRMRRLTVGSLLLVSCPVVLLAGDGLVALQTADPSCRDDSGNIYVNCFNGTVTDSRTGLTWLANANCLGLVTWHEAQEFVAGLRDIPADSAAKDDDCGLADGSSPGEWRLPSLDEWEAMVADALLLGCSGPTVTDDTGSECWTADCGDLGLSGVCSFSGVQSVLYWSSTTFANNTGVAWVLSLNVGNAVGSSKASPPDNPMWPVRGGQ